MWVFRSWKTKGVQYQLPLMKARTIALSHGQSSIPLFYNPGPYVSGYFTISPHYSGGVIWLIHWQQSIRVTLKLPVMVTSALLHTLNIRESISEVTSDNSLHFFSHSVQRQSKQPQCSRYLCGLSQTVVIWDPAGEDRVTLEAIEMRTWNPAQEVLAASKGQLGIFN